MKCHESQKSYAATLEEIFSNPNLDIKKRIFADQFLKEVYENEEVDLVFKKAEDLLVALFTEKAIIKNNTYPELDKTTLIQVLKESGIIRAPEKKKADAPKEDKKAQGKKPAAKQDDKEESKKEEPVTPPEQLYQEADALASIEPVNSFEEG